MIDLGGDDPYSASKACAELIAACWRNSFFSPKTYGKEHGTLLATVRAGNVLGGGDWAADRIIPDVARAAGAGGQVLIRNPQAVRPWQHVLEPLSGYLLLGQRLLEGRRELCGAWNFGPSEESRITVRDLVALAAASWPSVAYRTNGGSNGNEPAETGSLMLDSAKARLGIGVDARVAYRDGCFPDDFLVPGILRTARAEDRRRYRPVCARRRNEARPMGLARWAPGATTWTG